MKPFITLWSDSITTMPTRAEVLYQLIKRNYIRPNHLGYWTCHHCKPSKKVNINLTTCSLRKWIYYVITGELPLVLSRYEHNTILDYRMTQEYKENNNAKNTD